MGFWIFMLIMVLLIPVTMIGFGKFFLNKAPKEINGLFGYRTNRSTKNKDTWEFAHKYCGKIWYVCGAVLLPLSVICMLFVMGKDEDTVGTLGAVLSFLQLVALVGAIFPTERALRRIFDEEGRRRAERGPLQ